ncbi:hypothetical protein [Halococcoides cellulosivorans]|uniref:hypothetical protein n=1 Tax=Halococcoides cellulosivorans TaxID=1679096 RepID=UPI00131ED9CF|nr:hypothetical protein [Halococcoides cellulosivorans]
MNGKNTKKISVILGNLFIATVVYLTSLYIPTNSFRDVFFYAEYWVANEIIRQGSVPQSGIEYGLNPGGVPVMNLWGKIGSDITLPITSIIEAELSLVTGIGVNEWLISFPSFIVIALSYFLIIDNMVDDRRISVPISLAGGVSPVKPPDAILSIGSTEIAIFLISMYVVSMGYAENDSSDDWGKATIVLLPIMSIWLAFNTPSLFLLFTMCLIAVIIVKLVVERSIPRYLTPVAIVSVLVPRILQEGNYVTYGIAALQNLRKLDISNPFGSNTATPDSILPVESYGLIVIVVLFPLGLIGGVLVLNRIRTYVRTKEPVIEVVLFVWGIVIFGMTTIFLSTGEYFLVTRAYTFSFPLLVVGAAIGIAYLNNNAQILIPIITTILVVFALVFGLQVTTPHQDIQTYNQNSPSWSEWVMDYENKMLVGDMKMGSPLVSSGYYDYYYPRSETQLNNIYYSTNMGAFCNEMDQIGADHIVLTGEMREKGLYIPNYARVPLNSSSFWLRSNELGKIYSNGGQRILTSRQSKKCRISNN